MPSTGTVVSCVVLLLVCVCVCDLFLFCSCCVFVCVTWLSSYRNGLLESVVALFRPFRRPLPALLKRNHRRFIYKEHTRLRCHAVSVGLGLTLELIMCPIRRHGPPESVVALFRPFRGPLPALLRPVPNIRFQSHSRIISLCVCARVLMLYESSVPIRRHGRVVSCVVLVVCLSV